MIMASCLLYNCIWTHMPIDPKELTLITFENMPMEDYSPFIGDRIAIF